MTQTQPKIKASTQEHLDIEDIVDDLIIFKTGWVGMVLGISAVNFDLLSEVEQDATIYAYGAFLNSLTFPVQILIRSKKADITSYFQHLAEAENAQTNPDMKAQIKSYEEFISSIVSQKTVLDKRFYLVINYSPLERGLKGLSGANAAKGKSKKQLVVDANASLTPKRDHIIKQMGRVGLDVRQLSTKDLIELFYDIYNPAPTGTQRVILDTQSYTTPIVEPAVEIPAEPPAFENKTPTVTQPAPSTIGQQQQTENPIRVQSQEEALRQLQEATAKAAQIISQNVPKANLSPSQINSQENINSQNNQPGGQNS